MNTKEAIEEMERTVSANLDYEALSIVIKTAKCWEEFKNKRPRSIGTYWEKYINKLEQKYFPKE